MPPFSIAVGSLVRPAANGIHTSCALHRELRLAPSAQHNQGNLTFNRRLEVSLHGTNTSRNANLLLIEHFNLCLPG
jgi:hypothetical protein